MKIKSKYSGLLKLVILTSVIVLIVLGMESVKVKNIEIVGGDHYTGEEIKEKILDTFCDKYTLTIMAKEKLGIEHESIPFVEKVEVEVVDRNSVRLTVYDKKISGCVEHMGSRMYFDREGIVVESTTEKLEGIPSVTGVSFTKVVLNERLSVENNAIFSRIMELTQLFEKYSLAVDEINFDLLGNVTLYTNGSMAQLGKPDNFDYHIEGLKNLLEAAGEQKYRFDMRYYGPENTKVSAIPINN